MSAYEHYRGVRRDRQNAGLLECAGRAQRRRRFGSRGDYARPAQPRSQPYSVPIQSGVALRFPPQSKTPGTATECSPSHGPFIQYSIIAAVAGSFGDTHSTERTEGSSRFINPLMVLYWGFRLDGVVHRNLYLDQIRNTETAEEVSLAIERFREGLPNTRPWITIPC